MLGAIKGFFLKKGVKGGFDSALASVRKLPLEMQHRIAADVRKEFIKLLQLSDKHPEEASQDAIKSLLQHSTYTRQMLVKCGISNSSDDPSWLHQALLESSAMAMLAGDETLVAHVFSSIAGWTGQFQFDSSSPISSLLDLPVSTQIEEEQFPISGVTKRAGIGSVEVLREEKVRTTKNPRQTKTSVAQKKSIKKRTQSKFASVSKSAISRKKISKVGIRRSKKTVKK